ncbi:30S ribosomal protein S17 [Gaiella sp.]|uniref:30S ribosomal protein S17 n=1 Tax=Gaiella sp. TaxID=2663207 RepID=UPI0039C89BE3
MADEDDVKGTPAEAEEPTEDEQMEAPTEEAAEAAAEEPVAEAAAEEPVAEAAEEPEPVDEAPADEAPADEAAADEAPADEPVAEAAVDADEPEPAADEAAEAAPSGPKPKRKRLPRALRPTKTRPKRARSTERKTIVRLEKPEQDRGRRQERQGKVVSDAMEKTIVVEVAVVKAHPRYKKVVRRTVKFHAHDERSEAKTGDLVRIVETRPISRTKRWRLVEVLEAAK